ncbi:hypothetical protein F511_42717 [Dorcoceras hygrometricum]|uniref:Uncharacterized protein n=1 Tax=Dorcoceras hygrometricum TaxID=472368 RepID=A0A2Z7D2K5_9LAMI|nr:hypothetical protein F511_42717 [Dorcoceras hygrometricum]
MPNTYSRLASPTVQVRIEFLEGNRSTKFKQSKGHWPPASVASAGPVVYAAAVPTELGP